MKVVYQINEEPAVEQRWRAAEGGRSLTFPGDVVRLLRSMPDGGRLLIRVYAGKGSAIRKHVSTGRPGFRPTQDRDRLQLAGVLRKRPI